MPRLRVFVFPIPAPIPLWIAVIGGFIILSIFSPLLGIAWQAHLGGLVLGLVAGYIFRRRVRYYYT
jgi:membrane associated rhomboid family serine protease